jgi:hypothetical protein
VFQSGKICNDDFPTAIGSNGKLFKFMIKTEHLKFILHSYYFAICLYSNGK